MNYTPKIIKRILKKCINEISVSPELFAKNPGKDFTRERKLPFDQILRSVLSMTGKSLRGELMRWGIETSFRDLKYSLALSYFHSKKTENILQEIFAKLTMYNFAELITSHVVVKHKTESFLTKSTSLPQYIFVAISSRKIFLRRDHQATH